MESMQLPADLLWVVQTGFESGFSIKPHAHPEYYHLLYVVKGFCQVTVKGEVYPLESGMFMLACPDDVHGVLEVPADAPAEAVLEIKFVVFSSTLGRALEKLPPVIKADALSQALIPAIVEIGTAEGSPSVIEARRHYLSTLLYYLCTDVLGIHKERSSSYIERFDTDGFSKATIAAIRYISEHYPDNFTLEHLGEATGYNKNYLCTAFKRDLGSTVSEFLNLVRIQKAAELLYYSDGSLPQICAQTGFTNVSHFTRTFKKLVGVPPGQYRRSFPDGILVSGREELRPLSYIAPVWADKQYGPKPKH